MAKVAQFFNRYGVLLAVAGALLLVAALAWTIWRSLPPRQFSIATGREGGGYYLAAQAYKEFAVAKGYTLNVIPTAGSLEALHLLESGKVDLAFVQGGVALDADPTLLSSVASMYFEPLWVFYRKASFDAPIEYLDQLRGKRISVGEEGSGTKVLAELLLGETGVPTATANIRYLESADAADALFDGSLDAAFFVTSPRAEVIHEMLLNPDLALMNMQMAEAYGARWPFLSALVGPAGVVDPGARTPAEDVHLVATTANLLMRNDFHPDLLRLVVMAAVETHQMGGVFEERYEFPNFLYTDLPVHPKVIAYAEQLKKGESILDNYLPFWAAALIDRYLLFVVPALLLLIPIVTRSPLLYEFYVRRKITRWYSRVREIEQRVGTMRQPEEFGQAYKALDEMDETLAQNLRVAQSYMPDLYDLRTHVEYVRAQVQKHEARVRETASASPAVETTNNGLPAAPESVRG